MGRAKEDKMKVRNSIKIITAAFLVLLVYLYLHPKSRIWGLCMPNQYYNEFIQKCDSKEYVEPNYCPWPADGSCHEY